LDIGEGKEVSLDKCPHPKLLQQCIKYSCLGFNHRNNSKPLMLIGPDVQDVYTPLQTDVIVPFLRWDAWSVLQNLVISHMTSSLERGTGILESLRKRAHMMTDGFNSCKNFVSNFTEGQSFSEITTDHIFLNLPILIFAFLEATGISTVPGLGFGQKEGVFHLRTTILPTEDMPAVMESFKKFNDAFMNQYEGNFMVLKDVTCKKFNDAFMNLSPPLVP
ncbi:hypothetical protein M8C21_009495, partial [Ambrosia artemisiifolia]